MSDPSSIMKRTSSMCSLPSPPADSRMELGSADEEEVDHDVTNPRHYRQRPATILSRAPKRVHTFLQQDAHDEEVDELETDDDETSKSDEPLAKKRQTSRTHPSLALGSPVNVSTAGTSRASRKQLLNPFFLADDSTRPSLPTLSSSPERPAPSSSVNLVSPTRHSRRRIDPDRIRFNNHVTPPQKSRTQLQGERIQDEAEEALAAKRREMMGWNDPNNPFLDKDDEMFKRNQAKGQAKRPETLTYVKRGERIRTSIPFTAVLTSSSPAEDPFTYTTPRLLFPPAAPKPPATPPSSFLQALRASSTSSSSTAISASTSEATTTTTTNTKPLGPPSTTELPPTPVTLKRKPSARFNHPEALIASNGYKKMKLPTSEAQHHHQLQQRNGLRQ